EAWGVVVPRMLVACADEVMERSVGGFGCWLSGRSRWPREWSRSVTVARRVGVFAGRYYRGFPQLDAWRADHRWLVQSIVAEERPSREGRCWMTSNLSQVASSNHLPANSLEADFGIVLESVLDSLKSDPSELRNAAYELARIKLQKECWLRNPPLTVLEMRRALLALEVAIERVGAGHSREDTLLLRPSDRLIESQGITREGSAPPLHDPPNAAEHTLPADYGSSRLTSKWLRVGAMSMLKAVATAALAVALFVILDRQFAFFRFPGETAAPVTQKAVRLGSAPASRAFSP